VGHCLSAVIHFYREVSVSKSEDDLIRVLKRIPYQEMYRAIGRWMNSIDFENIKEKDAEAKWEEFFISHGWTAAEFEAAFEGRV
jgi:hypothetical protein